MTRIEVQKKVLSENERVAKSLRDRIRENRTYASNLISSPGAGKTLLLERTLAMFPPDTGVAVLVCPSSYDLGEHDKIVILSVCVAAEKARRMRAGPVQSDSSLTLWLLTNKAL